jgi:hypothetical protein
LITGHPEKDIQIFAKTLGGSGFRVTTNTCAMVRSVVDFVHDRVGVAWGQMRLAFGGKQLETDRFLSDQNIQMEATIHLVLQLHECPLSGLRVSE